MVDIIGLIAVDLIASMAGQFFPLRTEINLFTRIEREVRSSEETWLGGWSLPALNALLEALLIGKVRIAFTKLNVGDISSDLFIPAQSQTVERMIVAVCGELFSLKIGFVLVDGNEILFRICQHSVTFAQSATEM